ncbi:ABC transporter permease subunit [Caulobacter segnis]|uniref:ABC transporter permease subunit n=1 Tax=Caulobacter segnis TaxID=88688 RepID=UPI0024108B0D|nr:ABC transporter permease subunit [Caulobacter segnis]MDG2523733.1 ABC transporter permease subunit [Caulobacter segnis]
MKTKRGERLAAIAPFLWLGVFFLFPFALVLKLSFSDQALAMPPYAPQIDWSAGLAGIRAFMSALDLETYARLKSDDLYLVAYLSSLRFAAIGTLLCLLVGYPIALGMARCAPNTRNILLLAVILPFWTSFLIRVYAWIAILKPEGLLNMGLEAIGLPGLSVLNTQAAVYVGLIYCYLPFMVLPIYAVLEKQDHSLLEAAADLGSPPWKSFWQVTVPLSLPGVTAGALLCFIPMVGEFVVPDLLGGVQTLMIGKTIWTEFFANRDWPSASAVAVVLLLTLVIPIVLYQRQQAKALEAGR